MNKLVLLTIAAASFTSGCALDSDSDEKNGTQQRQIEWNTNPGGEAPPARDDLKQKVDKNSTPAVPPEQGGDIGYVVISTDSSGEAPVDLCWLSQPDYITVAVTIQSIKLTPSTRDCVMNEPYASSYHTIKLKSLEILSGESMPNIDELIHVESRAWNSHDPGFLSENGTGVAAIRSSRGKWFVDRWITTFNPAEQKASDITDSNLKPNLDFPNTLDALKREIQQKRSNFDNECNPEKFREYRQKSDEEYGDFIHEAKSNPCDR